MEGTHLIFLSALFQQVLTEHMTTSEMLDGTSRVAFKIKEHLS